LKVNKLKPFGAFFNVHKLQYYTPSNHAGFLNAKTLAV